jgi:hypothetical protein
MNKSNLFESKYLKYKTKYLLQKQIGGQQADIAWLKFQRKQDRHDNKKIYQDITTKLKKSIEQTSEDIKSLEQLDIRKMDEINRREEDIRRLSTYREGLDRQLQNVRANYIEYCKLESMNEKKIKEEEDEQLPPALPPLRRQ